GRNVATYQAGAKSDNEVVEMMIGREYSNVFPPKPQRVASDAPPVIEVRNLFWHDRLNDISLAARAGEVVGLGGLDGQGQREFLLALFGVLKGVTGEMLIDGKRIVHLNLSLSPEPIVEIGLDIARALLKGDVGEIGAMLADLL